MDSRAYCDDVSIVPKPLFADKTRKNGTSTPVRNPQGSTITPSMMTPDATPTIYSQRTTKRPRLRSRSYSPPNNVQPRRERTPEPRRNRDTAPPSYFQGVNLRKCFRCLDMSHTYENCPFKEHSCSKCGGTGHTSQVHGVVNFGLRMRITNALGSKNFMDWLKKN